MQQKASVALPNGETVLHRDGYKVSLRNRLSPHEGGPDSVQLIGFDVILGMDWLFNHFASFDCRQKMIAFQVPGMEDKLFHGGKLQIVPGVITHYKLKRSWVVETKPI